jgi:hypothetical protein
MATHPKKRKPRQKHIVARSITLKDAKGKPRIFMDAGDGDGYVTICLFGEDDRSIQIATLPEGGLHISLHGQRSKVTATLGMTSREDAGLSIRDRQGKLGTMLRSTFHPGKHGLVLFSDGQPCWSAPKPTKRKTKMTPSYQSAKRTPLNRKQTG